MLESLQIAFVGSGAMGEAMIKGLLARSAGDAGAYHG